MKTITDKFREHLGAKEWDKFVCKILEWYYGKVDKKPWCAMSCSYMANELGILDQLGGKQQNVYMLMKNTYNAWKKTGKGEFKWASDYEKGEKLKKGDVVKEGTVIFMLRDGKPPMTAGSGKHVTTADKDFVYENKGYFPALGGNQSDEICVKQYTQKTIYAVFYPEYEPPKHKTLRKGDKGPKVRELQEDLNHFGYRLAVDGSFGAKTENAVKKFQTSNSLKIDGIVGPRTWAMIDKLLQGSHRVTPTTLLNLRKEPNAASAIITTLIPGKNYFVTTDQDGWYYFPDLDGWANSKYLVSA